MQVSMVERARAQVTLRATDEFARQEVLYAWDFTTIKRYMVEQGIYPADRIDAVEREYRRYLTLCLKNPGDFLPISTAVDDFWHTHIIFTDDYTAMCKAVFGTYLHHRPAILTTQEKLDEFFESTTLTKYAETFGKADPTFWSKSCCTYGCGSINL